MRPDLWKHTNTGRDAEPSRSVLYADGLNYTILVLYDMKKKPTELHKEFDLKWPYYAKLTFFKKQVYGL